MKRIALAAAATFALSACGAEEETLDTDYESSMEAPVPDVTGNEPVPDNDSIEGGLDEQVDAAQTSERDMPADPMIDADAAE
ncbi:hypothetical protein [Aurantiacibacter aquimixticola]|uniref:Argininosuccinate lyase n=1 Tax=Aurantiacibacter aquimixticola TaxID=1958945 RepID=A0A419RTS9_9SPHN|nr:hypothetical protein [Aurantiacibacter aquimixticola]RJY09192.1 hypothetical protein D6201_07315 [Aurantiacibacter aquimixticola]